MKSIKRRFSIEKAEWSDEREGQYKKECYDIVFSFRDKIKVEDETVFIQKNDGNIKLEKPLKSKTFWFGTWLRIRDLYQIN
ncbi:hypothetical protein [Bacillus sp. AFS041924]|uniref:hypothetical protein n=1 Tax=Bacillus sp. AFS041924 TaxID=2033503 RepID=UPI000BFD6678|nr:hypothetical protein [Bacillus sp. AFS041924]PGS48441.1 hypothetical protein COC46_17900 [Bacillus sp. AFS041924]